MVPAGDSDVDNESINTLLYGMFPDDISKSNVKCDKEVESIASDVKEKGKSLWKELKICLLISINHFMSMK